MLAHKVYEKTSKRENLYSTRRNDSKPKRYQEIVPARPAFHAIRGTLLPARPHHLPFLFRIESEAKPFLLVSVVFLRRFPTTPPARRVAARRDIRRRFHLLQRLRRHVARSEIKIIIIIIRFRWSPSKRPRRRCVLFSRDQLCARRHRNPSRSSHDPSCLVVFVHLVLLRDVAVDAKRTHRIPFNKVRRRKCPTRHTPHHVSTPHSSPFAGRDDEGRHDRRAERRRHEFRNDHFISLEIVGVVLLVVSRCSESSSKSKSKSSPFWLYVQCYTTFVVLHKATTLSIWQTTEGSSFFRREEGESGVGCRPRRHVVFRRRTTTETRCISKDTTNRDDVFPIPTSNRVTKKSFSFVERRRRRENDIYHDETTTTTTTMTSFVSR